MSNIHSHGRGGAGNIGEETETYVDGDIVREGVSNPSATHVGRGGVGNVGSAQGSPRHGPQTTNNLSEDVVPEVAMRTGDGHENYHTGRGGEGNIHKDKFGGHSKAQGEHGGLLDKAKHALGLDHKKETTTTPKTTE